MNKQNLNLTTPKILEYAAKALLIYASQAYITRYSERSHVNITKRGMLTVSFNSGDFKPRLASVRIGDFAKYPAFVEKLLAMLNQKTGKNYTEKDLNIY